MEQDVFHNGVFDGIWKTFFKKSAVDLFQKFKE